MSQLGYTDGPGRGDLRQYLTQRKVPPGARIRGKLWKSRVLIGPRLRRRLEEAMHCWRKPARPDFVGGVRLYPDPNKKAVWRLAWWGIDPQRSKWIPSLVLNVAHQLVLFSRRMSGGLGRGAPRISTKEVYLYVRWSR